MHIPPNHTTKSVMVDILHVTTALARNMRFGYHEIEDLKQEGFIFALDALPKYDEEKSSLRTFLYMCVRSRFISMKRNQYQRLATPCSQCVFLDGECLEFNDKLDCAKYSGWVKRNESKRSLMETGDATNRHNEFRRCVSHEHDEVDIAELVDRIDEDLPSELRADFCRMRDGVSVSKKRRLAVEEAVLEICGEDIL